MQKRCLIWQIALVTSFISITPSRLDALDYDEKFLDKIDLRLADGRKVELRRVNNEVARWTLSLFDKKRHLLWRNEYSEFHDTMWNYGFFIRMTPRNFIRQTKAKTTIAVSIWDGGNAPCRKAFVFEVLPKELRLTQELPDYAIESGESLFRNDGKVRFTEKDCVK